MSETYSLLSQDSLSIPPVGPDLLDRLNSDHERIAHLIEQLLDINLQAVQQRIFEDLKSELRLHIAVSDHVFAPAFADASARVALAYDHSRTRRAQDQILDYLDQLSAEGMTSPKWMLIFGELKHAVEQYIDDHNERVFPVARSLFSHDTLQALSAEAETVRREFKQRYGISTDHVEQS